MRKLLTFNGIMWLIGLAAVIWLLGTPLLMNAWAAGHWQHVDCHLGADNVGYSYVVDGKRYLTSRRDFWDVNYSHKQIIEELAHFEPNTSCWVNPRDPEDAVLYLDAHRNLAGGVGRFFEAGLVLASIGIITWVAGRKLRSPAAQSAKRPANGQQKESGT